MATAQLVVQRIVLRVVVGLAVMADTDPIQRLRTQPHPTLHQEAAEAVAEGPVAQQSRAGREQVHLLSTRQPKCGHLLRFEKT